jgi:sulfur-oxidizing protein SoxX
MSLGAVILALAGAAPLAVVGDGIPQPLPGAQQPGDAARGRAIVASRQLGLCLLCHQAPIAEERQQGNLATNLAGAGSRWSAAQLRLRVADPKRLDAASLMPAYHRIEGLARVGSAWKDKPVLDAQQVEDVVAWLVTLK